ncbi:hypothetical protein D3C85_1553880 [compost metagenome]
MIHQIGGHDIGRRQRFAGMHQQGLYIEFGIDDEHGTGFTRRGHDAGAGAEVMIEGALGGFVGFLGVGGFVRGCRISVRRVGCDFEHSETPVLIKLEPSFSLPNEGWWPCTGW